MSNHVFPFGVKDEQMKALTISKAITYENLPVQTKMVFLSGRLIVLVVMIVV